MALRHGRSLVALVVSLAALAALVPGAGAHEPVAVPIADLTRQIADHPDRADLRLARAELLRIAGRFQEARDDLDQAGRLDPGAPRLAVCRAALLLDTGDPGGARRQLDRALAVGPVDTDALTLRARACEALGDLRAATADLGAAIARIARPSPDLYLARARLQAQVGDRAAARRGLDEARERIGAAASVELMAIELALADRDVVSARDHLAAIEAQAADRSAFAALAARVAAAGPAGSPDHAALTPGAIRPPPEPIPVTRTPMTAALSPVLPRHAIWRYATGADLGSAWRQPAYVDTLWAMAPGVLGYGEPFVRSAVPFGPDPLNRYPTAYFRTTFTMSSPLPPIVSLTMSARFDDGIVVWLNGVEAARRSITSGTVSYATPASSHEALAYETIDLSGAKGALVPGANVLAVEVHQNAPASNDLVWDADLGYSGLPHLTRGPYLQIATDHAVSVRWRTSAATDASVLVGTSPGALSVAATDTTHGTEHELRVSGLAPATAYAYAVGTTTDVLAGDSSYTFRTAPTPGTVAPIRVWVVGDSGQPGALASAVRDGYSEWCGARTTDLWLMLGDNAYSSGTDSEYQAAVFDAYPVRLRQCALWPTRGNHDVLHNGANNDYYELFSMPAAAEAGGLLSGTEAYYAFNWANVHFVCLDSEGSDKSPGGPMLTWLQSDLAANTLPWVIAFWHHPPYSKGSHDSDSESALIAMRQNALPILEAGGVDLVLCGHSHAYERSFLVDGHYGLSSTLTPAMIKDGGDGRPDGDGEYVKPIEAPSPHAGAVYAVAGSASQVSGGSLDHPVMVASLDLGGTMTLALQGDRLDAHFISQTGAVLDSFRIVKNGVAGVPRTAPQSLRVLPAIPNPFQRGVRIGFVLERPAHVRASVFDLGGRRIALLADQRFEAGAHELPWEGRDVASHLVANGVYLVELESEGRRVTRKIAFIH